MRKFTIFTVILTVIIIVIVAELFVNDYLPKIMGEDGDVSMELSLPESLNISTNVLGADIDYSKILSDELLPVIEDLQPSYPDFAASSTGLPDFEDEDFTSFSQNVFIRDDQIKSAGFVGAHLEKEPHNGFLYKTIYIDDIYDVEVTKTIIRTDNSLFAKVYVFQIGPMTAINEVYEVLKMRASEGLDTEVNEINDFGNGSFFMNDARRSNVTFLTVRIGSLIYGFSYPKEYHSQIKNLIILLDLEF